MKNNNLRTMIHHRSKKSAVLLLILSFLLGLIVAGLVVFVLIHQSILRTPKDNTVTFTKQELDDLYYHGEIWIDSTDMLDFLSEKNWDDKFTPDCNEYITDKFTLYNDFHTISKFNPDGSAIVLANPEGGACHAYFQVFTTDNFGESWEDFGYIGWSSYNRYGEIYTFDHNSFAFIPIYATEDSDSGSSIYPLFGYEGNGSTDFEDMIPGYESDKYIVVDSVVQTKSDTFIIVFSDRTDNSDGTFYFCGEYNRDFKLISELKPVG